MMPDPEQQKHKPARWPGVAIALGVWLLMSVLQITGMFDVLDMKLLDVRFRVRGVRPAVPELVLVNIDSRTVQAFENEDQWPLTRDKYALLADALNSAGARAVGFDLLFADTFSDTLGDEILSSLTSHQDNIIHSLFFPPPGTSRLAMTRSSRAELEELEQHGILSAVYGPPDADDVILPYRRLLDASSTLGHINVWTDSDGVTRRVPVLIRFGDRMYPSLSLALAAAAWGEGMPKVKPNGPDVLQLFWPDGRTLNLPLDEDGTTSLDFCGGESAFEKQFSMLTVLQWDRDGNRDKLKEVFQNRIVLIGNVASEEAVGDLGSTPFASSTPMLYAHANAVCSILEERFLTKPPLVHALVAMSLVAALLGLVVTVARLPIAVGTTLLLTLLGGLACQLSFSMYRLNLPAAVLLILPAAVHAVVATYRTVFVEKDKERILDDLKSARSIQKRLLPQKQPDVAGLDVFGVNIPAQELGGDYYDWLRTDDGSTVFALGDVSGKGVPAAILMSLIRESLHSKIGLGRPADIVREMHNALFSSVAVDRFATFFLAVMSPDCSSFRYCSAGHDPAYLVSNGRIRELTTGGFALGLLDPTEYTDEEVPFRPDDVLVLYSDGITECPYRGEMYGAERLVPLVARTGKPGRTAQEIGNDILDDVRTFAHGNPGMDDITVLVIRRTHCHSPTSSAVLSQSSSSSS